MNLLLASLFYSLFIVAGKMSKTPAYRDCIGLREAA
jgi:hypothetical protein